MEKFLTNRNILTEELQNVAVLKELVKSVRDNKELYKTYAEIVGLLATKLLESLKDDPTIEVKVPDYVIVNLREEIKREIRKSCI